MPATLRRNISSCYLRGFPSTIPSLFRRFLVRGTLVSPMTTQPLSLDNGNGLLTIKRLPAVVEVREVPLTSPTAEWSQERAHGLAEFVGNFDNESLDTSRALLTGLGLERPRSGEGRLIKKRPGRPRIRRRSSFSSINGEVVYGQSDSDQRRDQTGASFVTVHKLGRLGRKDDVAASLRPESTNIPTPRPRPLGTFSSQPWLPLSPLTSQSLTTPCGVVPPLTPPEDLDSFDWGTPLHISPEEGIRTVMNADDRSSRQHHEQTRPSSTSRPSEIRMPDRSNMNQDESSRSNWLGRACLHLRKRPPFCLSSETH